MKNIILCTVIIGFTFLRLSYAEKISPDKEVLEVIRHNVTLGDNAKTISCEEYHTLKTPLSLKEALSFSLYCNPSTSVKLAQAELALAEMQQLGIIESPRISFGASFPIESPNAQIAYEANATFDLMETIKASSNKKKGKIGYESAKWEVISDIVQILTNVKIAYYRYQALSQLTQFWHDNLAAAQSFVELAHEQRIAGNISELDEAGQKPFLQTAQLEFYKIESEKKTARIELLRLMGIKDLQSNLEMEASLSHTFNELPQLDVLKERINAYKPSLLAKKQQIAVHKQSMKIAKLGFAPEITIGAFGERDFEGNLGIGPLIQIALPFFGQQRTNLRKAKAALKMSLFDLQREEQNTQSELEKAYQYVVLAEKTAAYYRDEIVPLQGRILNEALKHYNFMLLGNYHLIIIKQNQIRAEKESIEALRDYWIAYAELENLLGGSLI